MRTVAVNTPAPGRGALLANALRTLAGVVLIAGLMVAPLYYGATRPASQQAVLALLAAGSIAWLLSCALSGTCILPPRAMRIGATLVLGVAAVWMIFLVQPELPTFTRNHLARISARWPFSVVPRNFSVVLASGIIAVFALFALRDLARDRFWRRSIAGAILLTGAAVALLGLIQNATRAKGIYWDTSQRMPGAFFGTFFHHTSAGAYLNTVWPLGFGLALAGIRKGGRSSRARLGIYGALVCAALALAAHSGHISRLPQVIAIAAFAGFALWAGLWHAFGTIRGLRMVVAMGAALMACGAVAFGATRFGQISARWNQLEWAKVRGADRAGVNVAAPSDWPRLMRDDLFVPSDHRNYPLGDRGAMYAAAVSAIRERPWFGWGPGGWTAAAAAHSLDPFIRTFYLTVQFAHQDYLQTWVEWGVFGAAGWLLLVPGAVIYGIKRLGIRPSHDFIGVAAVTGLAAVLVQSLVDFPLQVPAVQFNIVALAALAWSTRSAPPGASSEPPFSFT
ncbi:MAG TPA: O-antigen ligase family protein [Opitutus sp.]|nr:O-antigen ligase family protein [Opitutus sp.]